MQTRHKFKPLAMELHLPCFKASKVYVNSSSHMGIRCTYKSDAKGRKQGYFSFLGTPSLSEATKQAAVADRARGCHIGTTNKQRVLMHRHQGWNVRHGLCHIYMRYIYIYIYIWVVYSFCLFCCLFIIVTWWYIWCIVWQVASKRKYRHVW